MEKYRFLLYYIVGQGLAYGIDIGVFYSLTLMIGEYYTVASNVVGKFFAALFAYFFHGNYTFSGEKSNSNIQSLGYYFIVLIVNVGVTSAIIFSLQSVSDFNIIVIKFGADVFAIIFTFILMNKFVFPRARQG